MPVLSDWDSNQVSCGSTRPRTPHSPRSTMTSTDLDYSRGMFSKVGQPVQLAQRCDSAGKGLEHRGCAVEGEQTALVAFETRCLGQRLQSLLQGGPLVMG